MLKYFFTLIVLLGVGGLSQAQTADDILANYFENNGLYFPFSIEVKVGGQIIQSVTIEKIELNVDLSQDFFSFPEKE